MDLCALDEKRYGSLDTGIEDTPYENGSVRGLVLALGVPQEDMDRVAAQLKYDEIQCLYKEIWTLSNGAFRDLAEVQWICLPLFITSARAMVTETAVAKRPHEKRLPRRKETDEYA